VQENKILFLSIAILAFLVLLPAAMADDDTLFVDLARSPLEQDTTVSHAKLITINWNALNKGRNKEIRLNLFDGMELTAVRDRVKRPAAGGYIWVGHVPAIDGSTVTLSIVDRVLVGSIAFDGYEQYTIRHDGPGQILRKIDPAARIEVEMDDMVFVPSAPYKTPDKISNCEDGTQIDLLIAYTKAARVKTGGTTAIKALVNLRVADMNRANSNSRLDHRYSLAHIMETDYGETGNANIDLPRLKQVNDGHLDDVAAARDDYKADLSLLVISEAEAGTPCGTAYVMNELSTNFASYAYSVAALDYAGSSLTCSSLTIAHELGHNMGNLHDRESNNSPPLFPYSFGYQSSSQSFRTIMAYNCPNGCPRINHWSNPEILFGGEATGISYQGRDSMPADNARSMKQTSRYVANFRENCAADPAPTPTSTPPPGGLPTATPPSSSSNFGHKSFTPALFGK